MVKNKWNILSSSRNWTFEINGRCRGPEETTWTGDLDALRNEAKAKEGDAYTVELDCDAGEITITHERSQKFAKATHPGLQNSVLRPLCGIYYKGSKVSLVDP